MDAMHTISAVAARTGFTASALRYYEDAGLITPDRTDAGYRVYDERAQERIRFISRAKQLGLSLVEIAELMTLRDGEQCAPVAHRLRDFVDDKIRVTQDRIAELTTFRAELLDVRASLVQAGPGPCDDRCACHAPTSATSSPVALIAKAQSA